MPKDYIPTNDAEFSVWLDNLLTKATANKGKLNVSDDSLKDLDTLIKNYQQAFDDAQVAQTTLDAKVQAKKLAREAAAAGARARVRQIQAQPGVTDVDRAELRISPRDTQSTPSPAPSTRPVVTVDTSERLRHRLDYRDSATPNRRAKPAGVTGCEIYVFVGAQAPADPAEFRLIAVDPVTPYVVEYGGADAGKTAHYLLRWVNTRGERGPWSETASATITA